MAEGEGMDGASGGIASRTVFLSYASQDTEIANTVCRELESRGIRCWIAPRDVAPGALYADAIVRAINESNVLVVVLSQSAVASSHVGREVERAASKRKQIIAFRVDTATLSPELEYFLSNSQWIDVAALGMQGALAKLTDAVGRDSATTPKMSPAHSAAAIQVGKRSGGVSKRLAVAAAIIFVGAASATLAVRLWPSKTTDAPAPAIAQISDKSIAVLPFADMSEKKDQEYFADGMAEEVLDRLAKVPGLKVVGRASSFQFKGKSADPASIGAALGVAYLLEGSVRRQSGRVRVAAQLIDARTGSERWSDRFDSDVGDMLQVQETIAAELARALQIAVEADSGSRLSIKSTEAFDAYLRGVHSFDRYTQEGSVAAVADFQYALTLDPTFAPAATVLARTYVLIGSMGWLPIGRSFERAREAALLAQQLDPKSSSPHVVLAQIHVEHDCDWAGADRELQQAFALGPRDSYGAEIATELAGALGHWDEGRQLGIEAITLDPLNADAHFVLGYHIYMRSGHLAEAEQSIRRTLQINPGYGTGHYYLGEILMLEGHDDAALAEFRKETPDDGQAVGSAIVLFASGRKAESDAQLAEAIRQNDTDWPEGIASVYAFRGERDRAIEWLDRAYDARDHLYLLKGNLLFKKLAGDPRYKAFLRKINLPE